MRALTVLCSGVLLLALGRPHVASAQVAGLQFSAFDTKSGILVTRFHVLRVRNAARGSDRRNTASGTYMGVARNTCISFANTLPRDVTQVDFHFVFYDRLRNHAGEADLMRTGKFAPGATIDPNLENRTGLEDDKDCVLVPGHEPPIALAVVFVKSATFADGSRWVTSGPEISAHLGQPKADASP